VLGGYAFNWVAMPGRSYEILYQNGMGPGWGSLGSNAAGALQVDLWSTDAPPAGITQRFYRVRLLP